MMKRFLPLLLLASVLALAGCAGDATIGTENPPPGSGNPGKPALDRLFSLRPLKGAIYKPTPSDFVVGKDIYYDSDYCNTDFRQLWGPSGRDDLQKLKDAGVNFLHIYDWNQPGSGRNHRTFLDRCQELGIYVAVPISKWYVLQIQGGNADGPTWADNFVREVYPGGVRHPAVVMWEIGNEWENGFEQSPAGLAKTVKLIRDAEDRAGIAADQRIAFTSPVTFGILFGNPVQGAGATLKIKEAFDATGLTNVWNDRYVSSVNTFNPGRDVGPWASTAFPNAMPDMPFMIFELGKEIGADVATEAQQGEFYAGQLSALAPVSGNYLGQCVFAYVNEPYKGGTEATFGVYKIGTAGASTGTTNSGATYPIDSLVEKPSFTAMKHAYTGG